ncbi:histone deacetylase 7-like [Emys orbicularis]|uniref:histone deacetylase 7-like n=1 Tax=Emys orbicularis TaxID=82168 RepID=UPI0031FCE663
MDLRIGQRFVKPGSNTALLALKQTQQLQHQLFLASLHQQQVEQFTPQHMRVNMDSPQREAEAGQQEQELRLLLNKDKSKRSAVASTVVKQKLAEVILKKQQAALERTSNPSGPPMPYRSLEPLDTEGPAPPVLSPFLPQVPSSSIDPPEHFPLRKTASEPNLKVWYKPKKLVDRRKNPLTRKESAPPSLKRRPLGWVQNQGQSLQRCLVHCQEYVLSGHELSLPAYLGSVPGLGTIPFHFAHTLIPTDGLSLAGHHKPLGRTRSEPLPPNPKAIQQQLAYQQHHAQFLERLKQQTHLGKLMTKSREKPRLRQIPSSEDMEAKGGLPEGGSERSDQPRGRVELTRPGVSTKEPERSPKLMQPQEELVLQQQAYLWEHHQRLQHSLLKRQPPADSLMVPDTHGEHRPLSRAQSSPATATIALPAQDAPAKALSLPAQEPPAKPQFTTGLVYDSVMLKHQCSCGNNSNHPEHAGRIQSIWSCLQERGLRSQCETLQTQALSMYSLRKLAAEPSCLSATGFGQPPCLWTLRPRSPEGEVPGRQRRVWSCTGGAKKPKKLPASRPEIVRDVGQTAKNRDGPDFIATFRTVVMPIAHEFSPDVVLVSAGFDAADGHPPPLGGYKVSAKCFGYMTRQLMSLAGGAIVLALEGGHDLTAICDASEACVSALLGNELDPLPEESMRQKPNPSAVRSLEAVIRVQSKYWGAMQRFASKVSCSFLEVQHHDPEEVETVMALASLSVAVMVEKR